MADRVVDRGEHQLLSGTHSQGASVCEAEERFCSGGANQTSVWSPSTTIR
jgi:hypothetical protein